MVGVSCPPTTCRRIMRKLTTRRVVTWRRTCPVTPVWPAEQAFSPVARFWWKVSHCHTVACVYIAIRPSTRLQGPRIFSLRQCDSSLSFSLLLSPAALGSRSSCRRLSCDTARRLRHLLQGSQALRPAHPHCGDQLLRKERFQNRRQQPLLGVQGPQEVATRDAL